MSTTVRVDFFKPSGKWYAEEAVRAPEGKDAYEVHQAFKQALYQDLWMPEENCLRYSGMTAVVLETGDAVHFPLMFPVDSLKEMP